MKKIPAWSGACLLILLIGLSGVSCSKEKTAVPKEKDQIKVAPQEKTVVPQAEEKTPDKTMPAPGHGKATGRTGKPDARPAGMKNAAIARVNGADITLAALTSEMQMIGPQFIKDPSQKTPENVRKLKRLVLDILIFRELATQEAARQGMKIRPEAVDEAEKRLRANLGSADNYRKFLEMSGYTESSMRKRLGQDLLFEKITTKEIFKKAPANNQAAVEKRKQEWENKLKKKARIEIFLPEVEKEMQADRRRAE